MPSKKAESTQRKTKKAKRQEKFRRNGKYRTRPMMGKSSIIVYTVQKPVVIGKILTFKH